MKQSSQQQLQKITPLIKLVKNREQLYLQLLNFITKNIESSSNQHQQLGIFTKYLAQSKLLEKDILLVEQQLCKRLQAEGDDGRDNGLEVMVVSNVIKNNKQQQNYFRQILRLAARLIQILEASLAKTRNSLFNQDNRLMLQFQRFKRHLHNTIKGQTVHLGQFTTHILNFIKTKYKKQLAKIEKYVFKLESGATVALKQLYMKERSEDDDVNDRMRYVMSETDSPQKKSLKKQLLTTKSTKKGHKLYKSTKKQPPQQSDTKPPKQYTANKLLKFYQMMELSKKQFFQDMIYDKLQEEEHKKKLMSSLLERNKTISGQISTFYKKTLVYHEKIRQVGNYVSSGEEKEQEKSPKEKKTEHQSHSMLKNSSLRKSFVISKRKSSLNFQKNSKILTQHDQSPSPDVFIKTVKHLPVKRKSSNQTTQRSLTNKSKKLFVIKSPVVFQDDNIPQAPTVLNGQGWYRPPLTTRKSQKKNENLRLKRRNNPLPIENSMFNESFKFSENISSGGGYVNSNRFG